jgi:hypothetical protein
LRRRRLKEHEARPAAGVAQRRPGTMGREAGGSGQWKEARRSPHRRVQLPAPHEWVPQSPHVTHVGILRLEGTLR